MTFSLFHQSTTTTNLTLTVVCDVIGTLHVGCCKTVDLHAEMSFVAVLETNIVHIIDTDLFTFIQNQLFDCEGHLCILKPMTSQ